MELVLLGKVCVVSLPSGENLISRFSFKEVQVKVTGRRLPVDLIMLEIVDSTLQQKWTFITCDECYKRVFIAFICML